MRIQIYSAVITYYMFAINGHDLELERSIYDILTIPGIPPHDKTPIKRAF